MCRAFLQNAFLRKDHDVSDPVTVTAEATPNPHSMKFVMNRTITAKGISITNRATATAYPLAAHLFDVPGVKGLYMMNDFISVTKEPSVAWEALVGPIQDVIAAHYGRTAET